MPIRMRIRTAPAVCAALAALVLGGCAQTRPYVPPSEGHIMQAPKPMAEPVIPPPARVSSFVPPPKPTVKPQTYSVVVNEVPVKELLNALARDTRQNIDIHPTVSGLVSLNAIDETLPAILERISKQVDIRYRVEGNTVIVSPDLPYVKTYVVNYVNIQRNTSSITGASGQIGTQVGSGGNGGNTGGAGGTGGGGGAGGGAGAGNSGNSSTTTVTTTSTSDFWKLLENAVRAILNSALQQSLSAEGRQARLQTLRQEQELRVKQLEATARGPGAPAVPGQPLQPLVVNAPPPATLLPDDVIVNPLAGTITINGTEKQHQLVQDYLTKVERGAQRQVLIEATIVEVTLSNAYQGGVDWFRLSQSGGFSVLSAMIGPRLAAAPFFAFAFNEANRRPGDIGATVKLLEQFGRTKVLSSPKLMALNNQTALLKVVTNLVYFEVQVQQGIVTTTGAITPATINTTARTVSEGVVMSVTPQINEDGRVTLTVRPTISDRVADAADPNPLLIVQNTVPVMRVREMESVLQVSNGQTIVLGGLMQDRNRFDRDQMPVVGDVPAVGEAFRFRNEQATKTELIIFLRPTVIDNPTLESDELRFFKRYLPNAGAAMEAGPAPR